MQVSKHKSLQSTRTWYLPKQDEANGFYCSPSDIIVHVTHLDKDKHYKNITKGKKWLLVLIICCNYFFNYKLEHCWILHLTLILFIHLRSDTCSTTASFYHLSLAEATPTGQSVGLGLNVRPSKNSRMTDLQSFDNTVGQMTLCTYL